MQLEIIRVLTRECWISLHSAADRWDHDKTRMAELFDSDAFLGEKFAAIIPIKASSGPLAAHAMVSASARSPPIHLRASQISNFENGKREPELMLLLAYAKFAHVAMESLVDEALPILGHEDLPH